MLALIASPFLGFGLWLEVSAWLGTRGVRAVVADCEVDPVSPFVGTAVRIVQSIAGETPPAVLVGHSGAGPLIPSVVERLPAGSVRAIVFVDAMLRSPVASWIDRAPSRLAKRLNRPPRRDFLPTWDQWFDADPIEALVTDPAARESLRRELPFAPRTFIETPAPVVDRWREVASHYLRLGPAYETEAAKAEELGWRVERLDLHHLAIATAPDKIAAALLRLSETIIA